MNSLTYSIRLLLLVAFSCLAPDALAQATDTPDRFEIEAVGQAGAEMTNARQAAIDDGLRRCVESVFIEIRSDSQAEDFSLVRDVIVSKAAGFIERYEVLQENPDQDGVYTVRLRAVVSRGEVDAQSAAFEQLMRQKGSPRVIVVGEIDGEAIDQGLRSRIQNMLRRRGVNLVDTSRREVLQKESIRKLLETAESTQPDSIDTSNLGADILFVIRIDVDDTRTETVYGEQRSEAVLSAYVRVVRADTGTIIASEYVETVSTSDTPERAVTRGKWPAMERATELAIKWTARHWLDDVSSKGREISLRVERASAERINILIQNLQRIDGINDVILDSLQPKGVTELRVVTPARIEQFMEALLKVDPGLEVLGAGKNSVRVGLR